MPCPFCISPASTPGITEAAEAAVEELGGTGWVGDSGPDTICTHSQGLGLRSGRGLLSCLTETGGPWEAGAGSRAGKRGSWETYSADGTDKKWAGPAHQMGGKWEAPRGDRRQLPPPQGQGTLN